MLKHIYGNAPSDLSESLEKISTIVYVRGVIDDDSVKEFEESISKCLRSGQEIIPIVLNSPGGHVDVMNAMIDIIDTIEVPVATICLGQAMSAAAILLSCGDEGLRFAGPNSRIMIHHIAGGVFDKLPEIKSSVEEMQRMSDVAFKRLAKNCGKPDGFFLDLLSEKKNLDLYLTPEQAFRYNIVNHIRVPELRTTVTFKTELI